MDKYAKIDLFTVEQNELDKIFGISKGSVSNVYKQGDLWIIETHRLNPKLAKQEEDVVPDKLPDLKEPKKEEVVKEEVEKDLLKELRENKQVPMNAEELKEVTEEDDDDEF